MLKFRCQHCAKSLKCDPEMAGRRGKCSGCQNVIVIPDGKPLVKQAVASPEVVATLQPPPPLQQQVSGRYFKTQNWILIGIGLAILLVLLLPLVTKTLNGIRERQAAAEKAREVEGSKAYDEGIRAWRDGLSRSDNPYSDQDEFYIHELWGAGFRFGPTDARNQRVHEDAAASIRHLKEQTEWLIHLGQPHDD